MMYVLYIALFYFINDAACQHGHGHSKNIYDKCEYKKIKMFNMCSIVILNS